jgi:hypothetical protein
VAGAIQVIVAHALGMEDPVQAEAHVPGPSRDAAQSQSLPQGPSTVGPTTLTPSKHTAMTPPHTSRDKARGDGAERMRDDERR